MHSKIIVYLHKQAEVIFFLHKGNIICSLEHVTKLSLIKPLGSAAFFQELQETRDVELYHDYEIRKTQFVGFCFVLFYKQLGTYKRWSENLQPIKTHLKTEQD